MTDQKIQKPFSVRVPRREALRDVILVPDGAGDVDIHLEEGSQAVFFGVFAREKVKVVLDPGARLEMLRVLAPGDDGVAIGALDVRQARDSSLRSFFLTSGGRHVKDEVRVTLEGEGAEVFLNGLHHLSGEALADSHTFIDHAAPNTASDQLYKSVLRDKAHSVFNGRIMVRRLAQLTNAYQLNKNLLLSPQARVDTKPELEIFADDVKCSHGAAVGQLDDDQLFYLQARGIDRQQAGAMLVSGFIGDVLGRIRNATLRKYVEERI